MIISFTNVIGAIRNVGKSIITSGLKMWLGFRTSETLGRELVVNGDFATDTDWTKQAGWTISGGVANVDTSVAGTTNLISTNLSLTIGNRYDVEYYVDSASGSGLRATVGGVNLSNFSVATGNIIKTITAVSTDGFLLVASNSGGTTLAQISNVSVKEVAQFVPDKSGNSNVGKLFTGKALDFNGSVDNVEVPNSSSLNVGTDDFTYCFWIYINSAKLQRIIDKRDTRGFTFYLDSSNVLRVELNDGTSNVPFTLGTLTSSVWQRVVISADRNGNAICYINGIAQTPVDISSKSGDLTDTTSLFIGADAPGGSGIHFDGFITDIQWYDTILSQADATFDYNNPNHLVTDNTNSTIALSNLKGYWAMSEGAGSIAYDSSGEGNNGTINGATYDDKQPTIPQLGMMDWAKSGSPEIILIQAPNNKGFDILGNPLRLREHSFNLGGSGYAEVADDNSIDFGTGDFTIETWLKASYLSGGSSLNSIIALGGAMTDVGSAGIGVFNTTSKFAGYVGSIPFYSNDVFNSGDWYHVVITRDSSLCTMYVDSVAQTDTATTNANITNSLVKYIGRDSLNTRFYSNLIDDSRLYNRALTQEEVTQNYNAGSTTHSAGSSFSDDFSSDYGN